MYELIVKGGVILPRTDDDYTGTQRKYLAAVRTARGLARVHVDHGMMRELFRAYG